MFFFRILGILLDRDQSLQLCFYGFPYIMMSGGINPSAINPNRGPEFYNLKGAQGGTLYPPSKFCTLMKINIFSKQCEKLILEGLPF